MQKHLSLILKCLKLQRQAAELVYDNSRSSNRVLMCAGAGLTPEKVLTEPSHQQRPQQPLPQQARQSMVKAKIGIKIKRKMVLPPLPGHSIPAFASPPLARRLVIPPLPIARDLVIPLLPIAQEPAPSRDQETHQQGIALASG